MELNCNAKKLIELLLSAGYDAYAVGGCVRDSIIGREVGDIDITTSATPKEVETVLDSNGIRYIETGIKHGTVTAVFDGENIEITTFRTDGDYLDNRHPENVSFVRDIKEDLSRRDFTMNAIAYNDKKGIVDLFCGKEDIENSLIRAVGDPDKRFKEDALRIMRAIRFASVLGFDIEKETKKAIFDNKELLNDISSERIFKELIQLLLGDNCEKVLLEYRDIIAVIIPELEPCFDYPQNSKWHIYDVYTHMVKSVALAPKNDVIRFSLLIHDIGKPFCKTTDSRGQDHFKGHPKISAEIAAGILKRLKVSREFLRKNVLLIKIHDWFITKDRSNIKMWLRILDEELIFDFIDLKIADLLTHNPELTVGEVEELEEIRELVKDVISSNEPYKISDLDIDGNALVSIGFKGRSISEELERLAVLISDYPEFNEFDKLSNQAVRDKFEIYGD